MQSHQMGLQVKRGPHREATTTKQNLPKIIWNEREMWYDFCMSNQQIIATLHAKWVKRNIKITYSHTHIKCHFTYVGLFVCITQTSMEFHFFFQFFFVLHNRNKKNVRPKTAWWILTLNAFDTFALFDGVWVSVWRAEDRNQQLAYFELIQ